MEGFGDPAPEEGGEEEGGGREEEGGGEAVAVGEASDGKGCGGGRDAAGVVGEALGG